MSIPALKLDPPQSIAPNKFQLTVRTADGTAIDSNRLMTMELRASTNLMLSPSFWSRLTNNLELNNGVVRINSVDAGVAGRRFFIVSEPR